MNEVTWIHREIDQVEIRTGSSIDDLQATFAVMSRTVEEIEADCRPSPKPSSPSVTR